MASERTAVGSTSHNGEDIALAEISVSVLNKPGSSRKQSLAPPPEETESGSSFSAARMGSLLSLCMLSTGEHMNAETTTTSSDCARLAGAQVPAFLLGGTLTFLAQDLQLGQQAGWLPTANAIATAAVSLFVGSLLDQTDKVKMMLISAAIICIGCVVLGTAQTLGQSLAAMTLMGIPSGLIELAAISTSGHLPPVAQHVSRLVALHSAATPDHSWADAAVLAPLIIGLALIALFVVWEWRGAQNPVIPRQLFSGQRTVALATGLSFIGGVNFYILQYIWPMALLNVWAVGPESTGLYGLAVVLTLTIGTVLANALLSVRKGAAKVILVGASLALTAFSGALLTIAPDNIAQSTVLAAFMAAGVGALTIPPTTVASLACPQVLISTCVALTATARAFGGSIGLSIAYVIFNNRLTARLSQAIVSSAVRAGLPPAESSDFFDAYIASQGAPVPALARYSTVVLDAAAKGSQQAYAQSVYPVWYISMVSGVCALVLALLLPSTAHHETDRAALHHNRESSQPVPNTWTD
nr:putative transporter c3h1.06c [Quercus suber]POE49549.1 putative transporter c3h1.06c [Quercus suber]